MKHLTLPVSPATVHWGYFSKKVAPALTLRSGDRATIETLTHHANDDYERMIANDPGAESVFHWTKEFKAVARRNMFGLTNVIARQRGIAAYRAWLPLERIRPAHIPQATAVRSA